MGLESGSNSLYPGQRLSRNQTLVSSGEVFEMGFFSPPELGKHGNLSLYTSHGHTVWSTNTNLLGSSDSVAATLWDDGNFFINNSSGIHVWQSFDYPTDTLLPGAYWGYDNNRGIKMVLKSWAGASDPSTGHFSAAVTRVSSDSSWAQLLLRDGFNESKFCLYPTRLWSDDVAVNIEFSFFYIDRYYSYVSMQYYYCLWECYVRYVLDVSGNLTLLAWLSSNHEWGTIDMELNTCDSPSSGNKENRRMNANQSGKTSNNNATYVEVAAVGLASLLVAIAILLIRLRKRCTTTSSKAMGGDTLNQYNYRDLRSATKNFTDKLGRGGFSTVYKGEFPDSTFVAVKELRGHFQEEKQLRAELNTVGLIQHKNLVRLLGFCLEGSKRFIIYDYMPNGSLESSLFQREFSVLDWGTRYNIALGTAKGLAYLHEHCRDCIIHCDIKPENILLDADFDPQVADFGLAKLLGRDFSRVLTTMRGTRGYLAPEWFSGVPITAKVDVYSYGQVLFEIISGRRNMVLVNEDLASYFPAIVFNALNNGEDVLPLVDPKLQGEFSAEEVTRACKVACWCIQDDENDRPTMKEVVQALEGHLDVGIPPIPRFFMSLAEPSVQNGDVKESEDNSTLSTLPSCFSFQPSAQSVQDVL